jgi:hypothetical protein
MNFINQEATRVQADVSSSGRRDLINFEYKMGQNRGRLLPPWPGSGHLVFAIYKHFQLAAPVKFAFCWEQTYPTESRQINFVCPICAKIKELAQRGIDASRSGAVFQPRTNWIDYDEPDPNKNPKLIDVKASSYNYLITTASASGCDLTSLDLGYTVMIVQSKKRGSGGNEFTSYETSILPGAPTLLSNDPAVTKAWVERLYDLRAIHKFPNWQSEEGAKEWQKLAMAANSLERQYTQGGIPQGPNMPQFQQPSVQNPNFSGGLPFNVAPPPQMAPQTMPQPVFTAPAPAPTPSFMQPPPVPQAAPAPAPPPPQGNFPTPFTYTQAPPQPQPFQAPQPPQVFQAPQPPPQPPATSQEAPPWDTSPKPAPSLSQSSVDGKPVCFGHSKTDTTVTHLNVIGGWSDAHYRCTMCPHEIPCKEHVLKNFAGDYVS